MNSKKNLPDSSGSSNTLRRPVQVVKKRSGPLDDALAEVHSNDVPTEKSPEPISPPASTSNSASTPSTSTAHSWRRRQSHIKDKEKEKRRERWLLTRKTWKYMTDAGRKLIPDGAQNRKDDIPKIEAHFQQVCSAEPRFILWRRKTSYPGAMRNSKKRLKQLLHHTGQKQAVPLTIEQIETEETNNTDQIIDLLQSYLKLDEACKTTTLLGSKTVRPDQTASPSAQRPGSQSANQRLGRSSGFVGMQMPARDPYQQLGEIDQLLERLRALQRSATSPVVAIPPEMITRDILNDKALLKQIYNSLKKQQLHRILSKHSGGGGGGSSGIGAHSMSLSSLLTFGGSGGGGHFFNSNDTPSQRKEIIGNQTKETIDGVTSSNLSSHISSLGSDLTMTKPTKKPRGRRSPPKSLDLTTDKSAIISKKKTQPVPPQIPKTFNACGTQTNFIPLQEIKRLAEEYKELKRETTLANTDDETEKTVAKPTATGSARRKSSIDNEDVSQSVSDTIKRYLRMARKKSVHDDAANRFKRVNYDRNLRNIRAKGEINPPGMDEGNSKAIQTLDAWPLIQLDFIRGHENSGVLEMAHAEWQKALEERIQKKLEYERNLVETATKSTSRSCSSSSAPTSPTSPLSTSSEQAGNTVTGILRKNQPRTSSNYLGGSGTTAGSILHSSSQFLSNLWHGSQNDEVSNRSSVSLNSNSAGSKASMQKSKSSSNVGQFVSRKILRSRSKSQTRPSSTSSNTNYSKWAPADKNTWTSETGDRLILSDAALQNLSDIESKYLQRVALEKISELNIGINVKLDKNDKTHKRRVLPKKKAMTTSFFDIGKKDEHGSCFGIFGNSLECCIANDRKQSVELNGTHKDRGSRGSIASLFRTGSENIRSCESLPSSTANAIESVEKTAGSFFAGLTKSSSMLLSSSQWDMRRKSQDFDGSEDFSIAKDNTELQVPGFVNSCIRYLEENGLNMVGLFRVSTSKKRVKQMREEFDKNHSRQIGADTCPHDVATLLKEFLRDLPEPLLCNHLYKAFLQTQKIRNRRLQLEAISHLIKLLPVVHRDTLYVLMRFLANVAAHSDDVTAEGNELINGNKMDSNNLATVFAPNILRSTLNEGALSGEAADAAAQQEFAINVIRIMIDHYEELFKVPAELIDIAYSYMLDECPDQLFGICEQRNVNTLRNDTSSSPLSSPDQVKAEQQANSGDSSTKKFYTRQSVMHENDASKSIKAPIRINSRRQRERHSSRESTSVERRQSSPNVLGKANIVSGSLQISMPMQTSHGPQQYDDLPYIEDVFYSPTENFESPNEYVPISGHLSLSAKKSSSDVISTDVSASSAAQTSSVIDARKRLNNEPKLPASISNIGGAIMRSKTAEFERMSVSKTPRQKIQSGSSKTPNTSQQLFKRQELISSSSSSK